MALSRSFHSASFGAAGLSRWFRHNGNPTATILPRESSPAATTTLPWSSLPLAPLPEAEAAVLARYRELFALAQRPAFAEGGTWDLMYCNEGAPGINPNRHYAFVRYASDEAWLVVCNFSDVPATVRISLPPELRSACPILPDFSTAYASATVPAWDASIIKLA